MVSPSKWYFRKYLQSLGVNVKSRDYDLASMQAAVIEAFWAYDRENLSTQCAYMYSIFRKIQDNGGETDYKTSPRRHQNAKDYLQKRGAKKFP